METQTKYFPEESLPFWDRLRCFSGIWEEVEYQKYLPVVVSEDGEILGTEGSREEVRMAQKKSEGYRIAGYPPALHIGARETENAVTLYWRADDGTYYSDSVGVMEMERWFREIQKKETKK